jgi:hypothetical protein
MKQVEGIGVHDQAQFKNKHMFLQLNYMIYFYPVEEKETVRNCSKIHIYIYTVIDGLNAMFLIFVVQDTCLSD